MELLEIAEEITATTAPLVLVFRKAIPDWTAFWTDSSVGITTAHAYAKNLKDIDLKGLKYKQSFLWGLKWKLNSPFIFTLENNK